MTTHSSILSAALRMHGGLLADGTYQPPRSLGRTVALDAWTDALRSNGGELFDLNSSLLDGDRIASEEQSRVLLRHGLGETFWNNLTIIGKIGSELIDRFWGGLVYWATVEQPRQFAAIQSTLIEERISQAPNADQVLAEFRAAA